MVISTHTPSQGVTKGGSIPRGCIWDFYSHALAGRDGFSRNFENDWEDISTHTPSQGVTVGRAFRNRSRKISTHTPSQGVTDFIKENANMTPFLLTRPRRA